MNSTSTAGAGNIASQLFHIWKALRDPSIPWAAKWLVPLAALVYWISPVDLIPFFPVDDIIVVLIALNVFMRMISHYQSGQPQDPSANTTNDYSATGSERGKTIETTWRVVE